MILVDTNILSTFAKIDRLELLFGVFKQKTLYISPNVFQELKDEMEDKDNLKIVSKEEIFKNGGKDNN